MLLSEIRPIRWNDTFCSVTVCFPRECMDCIAECGRLTPAGLAVPAKAALSLPFSSGQERKYERGGSWA